MEQMFRVGSVVRLPQGEVKILEFLGVQNGRETYKVVSASVRVINGVPVNVWIAQVIPTLTITGVSP
jgi:hypothetical protein